MVISIKFHFDLQVGETKLMFYFDLMKGNFSKLCECLFDLIFYVPSTIFQLCKDGSSRV